MATPVIEVHPCVPEEASQTLSAEGKAAEVAELRCNYVAELGSVALYEAIAELERDASRKSTYLQLAAAKRERAESFGARLRSAGASVPRVRITPRMRLFAKLVRHLSGGYVTPVFTARALGERRDDSESS